MRNEIKIGILAILAIGLSIWGYQYLKGKNLFSNSVLLYVEYQDVDLLKSSDPVYINGFQVGVVTSLQLKPADMQTIVAEISLNRGIKVPKNAVAEIVSTSVMSGKAIRLQFDQPCSGEDCAESGDYLRGKVLGMLDSMVGKDGIQKYMNQLKNGVGGAFDTLSTKISDPNSNNELAKSIRDLQASMESLKSITAQLSNLLASSSRHISGTMKNVNAITENLASNNEEINGAIGNLSAFSNKLNELPLDQTMEKTNTAMTQLDATLQSANSAVKGLDEILAAIKNKEGSLGQLVYDQRLYDNLEKTSKNLELLLQDFRLNPKRYVNVSVFGKKQKTYEVPEKDPAFEEAPQNNK